MNLKVCGLKYSSNIKEVLALNPDYIGFIFYKKSPRNIMDTDCLELRSLKHPGKTAVFVNENTDTILNIANDFNIRVIQLHGNESPKQCSTLKEQGYTIIKAFSIDNEFDFKSLSDYREYCDYYLFDTKTDKFGGSGNKFNWNILKRYDNHKPIFLSGGISPTDTNITDILPKINIHALDLNSCFENNPGEKNIESLSKYFNAMNKNTTDENGYYGEFGGAYIPEMLRPNIELLKSRYKDIIYSSEFREEYISLLKDYVGRPSPLYFAKNLSKEYRTNIYIKREDLNHTGSHKINNVLGQALLAKRLGKSRIIAETGAGQHGVATATVCALLGLECIVYMGAIDIQRQAPNVSRMQMLGAKVVPATSGSQTLKDATNEALRDWINNPTDTYYLIGSVVGPHPYPSIVAEFQSIISQEIKSQLKEKSGKQFPDYVIACVGGGSNAAGAFYHFIDNPEVSLIGVEAAGKGINTEMTAATINRGSKGIIHGSKSLLIQDEDGQIVEPYSISAGLDYPGIGPLHAHLHETNRAEYISVTDSEALKAAYNITRKEGIIPALESAHALAALDKLKFNKDDIVIVNLSGRGDKDMNTYINNLDI